MRLLADENVPRQMVSLLRERGHDVAWVRSDAPGISDEEVLANAVAADRLLVTLDKDFGELAFRRGLAATPGIILLRTRGSVQVRAEILASALEARDDWAGQFAVVEGDRLRMTPLPS